MKYQCISKKCMVCTGGYCLIASRKYQYIYKFINNLATYCCEPHTCSYSYLMLTIRVQSGKIMVVTIIVIIIKLDFTILRVLKSQKRPSVWIILQTLILIVVALKPSYIFMVMCSTWVSISAFAPMYQWKVYLYDTEYMPQFHTNINIWMLWQYW